MPERRGGHQGGQPQVASWALRKRLSRGIGQGTSPGMGSRHGLEPGPNHVIMQTVTGVGWPGWRRHSLG
eukprot:10398005-Alexandrium_andersonii.AAC.1